MIKPKTQADSAAEAVAKVIGDALQPYVATDEQRAQLRGMIQRDIDAQYAAMRESFNAYLVVEPPLPVGKLPLRRRIRYAWSDFRWRVAAALIWLARKVHAGAVPRDDD